MERVTCRSERSERVSSEVMAVSRSGRGLFSSVSVCEK